MARYTLIPISIFALILGLIVWKRRKTGAPRVMAFARNSLIGFALFLAGIVGVLFIHSAWSTAVWSSIIYLSLAVLRYTVRVLSADSNQYVARRDRALWWMLAQIPVMVLLILNTAGNTACFLFQPYTPTFAYFLAYTVGELFLLIDLLILAFSWKRGSDFYNHTLRTRRRLHITGTLIGAGGCVVVLVAILDASLFRATYVQTLFAVYLACCTLSGLVLALNALPNRVMPYVGQLFRWRDQYTDKLLTNLHSALSVLVPGRLLRLEGATLDHLVEISDMRRVLWTHIGPPESAHDEAQRIIQLLQVGTEYLATGSRPLPLHHSVFDDPIGYTLDVATHLYYGTHTWTILQSLVLGLRAVRRP